MQIALNNRAKTSLSPIVAHELTHVFLAYYHPPRWLNEGIANTAAFMLGLSGAYSLEGLLSPSHDDALVLKWTRRRFNDFLSGKMSRSIKFQRTFYNTASSVVYKMLVDKVDLPRLLSAIRNKQKVTEALKSVSGKELLEFFPAGIRKEIEEDRVTTKS